MAARVEVAKTATFNTDDKRAQYARLAVFNHGVQEKIISKDKDVNTVSQGDLQKAFKSLTGGTLLKGKDGIELIAKLTRKGATDPKVAERGLTTAYAQEVRPFIMRGLLSEGFARRAGERKPKEAKAATPATKKAQAKPKAARKPRNATATRSTRRTTRSTPKADANTATEGAAEVPAA